MADGACDNVGMVKIICSRIAPYYDTSQVRCLVVRLRLTVDIYSKPNYLTWTDSYIIIELACD